MRAALVLVDMQRDFLDRPGLQPGEAHLIERLQGLLSAVRAGGIPVLHAHTLVHRDGSNRMPHWVRKDTWICVEGSPGALAPAAVAPMKGEAIYGKSFYSAFDNPELACALAAAATDTVLIAGIYTHACVRQTALDAASAGYRVIIASDAVASCEPGHAQLTLEYLQARGVEVLTTDAIAAVLLDSGAAAPSRGQWRHRNPANWDEVLDEVPLATGRDVAAAVARVGACKPLEPDDRRQRLLKFRQQLAMERDSVVEMIVRDVAKPALEAHAEFAFALSLLDEVLRQPGSPSPSPATAGVKYAPVGTIGLITPFNNPLAIPVGKLAPALLCGNTVVWKPALQAPGVSALVMQCLLGAGLGDFVAHVSGDADTGAALVVHPGVAAISVTGSVSSGRRIAAACALTGKVLQAELGGNNAAIVLADADLPATAQELAGALFSYSGQRCTAPRRVIVEASVQSRFQSLLLDAVAALRVGLPSDLQTQVGPVISRDQQQRLLELCAQSARAGAQVLCGGKVPAGLAQGCWLEPTLVSAPDPTLAIVQEEAFGPVAVLQDARDAAHAIELANGVAQGLVATLYSASRTEQDRFLKEAQAGILTINRPAVPIDPAAPFGGWKASGRGVPEHGRWDFEFYTRPQAVYRRDA